MASGSSPIAFGTFPTVESTGQYDDHPDTPHVQFLPPGTHSSGKPSGKKSDVSSGSGLVFEFSLDKSEETELGVEFGQTTSKTTDTAEGKSLNVNANEFVPSNQTPNKRDDAPLYPVNHGYPYPNPAAAFPIAPNAQAPFYYPYLPPPWPIPDPRFMHSGYYMPFNPHAYRLPYPPPAHPTQVAVVAPLRPTNDIRTPIRVSEESIRGNEFSVLPTKKNSPLSPSSLPSPPSSTHGDSGIEVGQSKSVSPPLIPRSSSHQKGSYADAQMSPVDKTPPITVGNNGAPVNDMIIPTTPTHTETTPTRLEADNTNSSHDCSTPVSKGSSPDGIASKNSDSVRETTPTLSDSDNQLGDTTSKPNEEDPVIKTLNRSNSTSTQTTPTSISTEKTCISSKTTPTSTIVLNPVFSEPHKATPTANETETVGMKTNCTKGNSSAGIDSNTALPTDSNTDLPTDSKPQVVSPANVKPQTPSKVMSWASVVCNRIPANNSNNKYVGMAAAGTKRAHVPVEKNHSNDKETSASKEEARARYEQLGRQIGSFKLTQDPLSLVPRGLRNSGNLCYIHAPLQALISCPSFYSLFQSVKLPPVTAECTSSPITVTETMVEFVKHFQLYPRDAAYYDDFRNGKKKNLIYEEPFWPDFIYNMLTKCKSSLSVKGRQEDAEEFLCWVLSRLHEEMVAALRSLDPAPSDTAGSTEQKEGEGLHEEEEEWQEVGPRNKSTITRRATHNESPISKMFGGKLQSTLYRQGMKETVVVEPFFSLQLDIQSPEVHSIKDALETMSQRESITLTGNDKEPITRRTMLAELPHCLILHIKRFTFDGTSSHKVLKPIEYNQELEIPRDLIAPGIRGKLSHNHRIYKLWAVVWHQGKMLDKGHYICDVYHPATSSWVRVNDNYVKIVPTDYVFNQHHRTYNPHVPYLLFYRRLATTP